MVLLCGFISLNRVLLCADVWYEVCAEFQILDWQYLYEYQSCVNCCCWSNKCSIFIDCLKVSPLFCCFYNIHVFLCLHIYIHLLFNARYIQRCYFWVLLEYTLCIQYWTSAPYVRYISSLGIPFWYMSFPLCFSFYHFGNKIFCSMYGAKKGQAVA
jgi:hypothetical protein